MEQLLRERQEFENLLYDFLINENNEIIIENYNLNENLPSNLNNLNENLPSNLNNLNENLPSNLNENLPSNLNENLPIFVNVHLINIIPEDFWEPVVVCLSTEEISNLETVTKDCECIICNDSKDSFKNLKCCNNDICGDCITNWFNKSVYCPFCKQDQRESSQRESSQRESSQRESSQRESSQRES
jgi:hypothetical protein